MTKDRWNDVKRIFQEASELEGRRRERYLSEACGSDQELRAEVESLLRSDDEATGAFLKPPEGASVGDMIERQGRDTLIGTTLGPYRVKERLAAGGMGVVYTADRVDGQFEQRVAIKVIKRGMDSEGVLRRFKRERQTLASLVHEYIARLLDGGVTPDGRPYLVMEYIEGEAIDEYCDARSLSVRARLDLFRKVCRAVQFAHANLVVHRDLKPSNIVVTAEGTPKLLDFGIAKLLDDGEGVDRSVIETGEERLMTPTYASPEQVRGGSITTRTDVYGLGLVLYELLSGHRPQRVDTRARQEIERIICEEQPTRPSVVVDSVETYETGAGETRTLTPESVSRTREGRPGLLRRRLAGDLDNVVMMALRKEAERRYASVEQLSEDIASYLTGRPVAARADTFSYRTAKFLSRHRIPVLALLLVVASLLVGIVATAIENSRARRAERDAVVRLETAQAVVGLLLDVFETSDPRESPDTQMTAEEILARGAEKVREQLADRPEVRATLLSAIGNAYRRMGDYEEARPLLEEALTLRKRELGEYDAATAASFDRFGMLLQSVGDHTGALENLERSRSIRAGMFEAPHPDLALSENNVGLALKDLGRLDEARACFERALEQRIELFGEENRLVAYSMSNLARLLTRLGELDEAERLQRRALAIRESILPPDHVDLADSMNSLAVTLRRRGESDEVESLYRRSIEILGKRYGEDHPLVARVCVNLSRLLRDDGRMGEARRLLDAAIGALERRYGSDHPEVATARTRLGELLLIMRRFPDAIEPFESAIEVFRETYEDDHEELAMALMHAGLAHHGTGDRTEAEAHFRESVAMCQRLFGPDHRNTKAAQQGLQAVLVERGE